MRTERINKKITFTGPAHDTQMGPKGNIDGPLKESMVHFMDDFLGDTVDGNLYTTSVANGGAVAISAAQNGTLLVTANNAGSDVAEVMGDANWYAKCGDLIAEFRLKVDNITNVAINIGFANTYANSNDHCAVEIGASQAVTMDADVTDFVGFVFDTGATLDYWYMAQSKNTTNTVVAVGTTAPVNATYETFRVKLGATGTATYYRNGVAVGTIVNSVTNTTALHLYAAVIGRTTAARNVSIDYIEAWAARGETPTVVN